MKFKTVLKAHAPLALCAAACTMAMLRLLILCAVGYAGLMLPGLFAPAVVLPFFFPRLCALLLRKAAPLWGFARQKFFCQAAQKD